MLIRPASKVSGPWTLRQFDERVAVEMKTQSAVVRGGRKLRWRRHAASTKHGRQIGKRAKLIEKSDRTCVASVRSPQPPSARAA